MQHRDGPGSHTFIRSNRGLLVTHHDPDRLQLLRSLNVSRLNPSFPNLCDSGSYWVHESMLLPFEVFTDVHSGSARWFKTTPPVCSGADSDKQEIAAIGVSSTYVASISVPAGDGCVAHSTTSYRANDHRHFNFLLVLAICGPSRLV